MQGLFVIKGYFSLIINNNIDLRRMWVFRKFNCECGPKFMSRQKTHPALAIGNRYSMMIMGHKAPYQPIHIN